MPNLFDRIAIGCANWDMPYNGSQLSDKDITKVLGYCQTYGIDPLDMATAYGNDFDRPNSYFKKIVKVQSGDKHSELLDEHNPYCLMAHDFSSWGKTAAITGVSLYEPKLFYRCVVKPEVVQAPYSLYDRRFEPFFCQWKEYGIEIHVRSIFLRGRILKDGIDSCECIKFCLCNPYIDKIILGVASFDELRRDLDFIFRWQNLEKQELDIIDPRRWSEK